jgi:NAD(P)-dependent dehydrogenase (short-subunit alcohol dehydrogenase family)
MRMLNINLLSCTNVVERATPALKLSKGKIVCISSICGSEVVQGAPVTYSVAKAALNAFVKCSANFLGKHGIQINAVAPGNILFQGSVWERKLIENPSAVQRLIEDEVDLQRLGERCDVSSIVGFLLSSNSSFITGSIIKVDGGQTRGL